MAAPSPPRHMDDLAPYYDGHRTLGLAIALGGILTVLLGAALGAVAGTQQLPVVLSTGLLVIAVGLLHRYVAAAWLQRRQARRMVDEISG